jgi:NADP-dependent 3-hydroxy acid dehydrogenase YdfG
MQTTPKVVLVTGASSGFGQASAALLTAQGFLVFGTSRAPAHNEASSFELLPHDVCSETSCVGYIGYSSRNLIGYLFSYFVL